MKNLLGFSVLLLSLVLFTTSCSTKKDDITPPAQTLVEKYPAWVNLTTLSTDGIVGNYPKIAIKLGNDTAHLYIYEQKDAGQPTYHFQYLGFSVNLVNKTVTFTNGIHYLDNQTFTIISQNPLTVTWNGEGDNKIHTYVLQ